ncbi:thioredoxin fold domain-containing protein [Ancylomarina sp. 16SWW S1-10-2]|uniref:thioredoxin fold domain-containing protein n=1 Tax=Ancylomarina sp. 16SWW S1-10-2 TaxID=2499681 RepID=UPI0012AD6B2C|nr:thioredoxin fold domain-containing protein [Ancylomarina sp. 16SWW S1-10-2]MRT94709.1 DUF255 domain-containing protein [Ancylomarina sp. 16SWW S1-10-2]
MKKILVIVIAMFVCGNLFSQGINFEHGTWAEAKAKAKAENKIIFVDVYTDWCGPCMRMAASVFKDVKVGELMNSNFISMKIDAEKGEGIAFAKEYEVKAFPTLLFIDGDGKIVSKIIGGKTSEEFIALAKIANDPTKQLTNLKEKYDSGKRDDVTVLSYIAALKTGRGDYTDVISNYLKELGSDKWNSKVVYEIVSKYLDDYKNPAFTYFIKNKSQFEKFASKKDIDAAIFNVYKMNFVKRYNSEGDKVVDELKEASKIVNPSLRNHITTYFDVALGGMDAYSKKAYRDQVDSHVANYATAWEINNYIDFMLYQKKNEDIPEELKAAEKWCLKGIELENTVEWRVKYINILIKQGRNDEALKLTKEELPKALAEIEKSTNKSNALVTYAGAFVYGEISQFPIAAQKGEEWIKEALKTDDSFKNNGVLMSALSACGKFKEAEIVASKLEKMAKNDMEKNYVKSLFDYLKQIQAKQE